jgi:hypothetical protein
MHHHTIKYHSHIYTPSIILSLPPTTTSFEDSVWTRRCHWDLQFEIVCWYLRGQWRLVVALLIVRNNVCFVLFYSICLWYCLLFSFFQFVLYYISNTVLKHTVYNCCLTVTISFKSFFSLFFRYFLTFQTRLAHHPATYIIIPGTQIFCTSF